VTIREGAATSHLPARAVFGMVGAAPNTDWLAGHCALDRQGFVLTGAAAGGGPVSTAPAVPGFLL